MTNANFCSILEKKSDSNKTECDFAEYFYKRRRQSI